MNTDKYKFYNYKELKRFFSILLGTSFLYILFAFFINTYFTNFIFVDGEIWYDFIISIIKGEHSFFSVRSSSGFILFYMTLFWVGGFWLVLASNICITYFIYNKSNIEKTIYLFFPFLFLSALVPSKDILVLPVLYFFIISIKDNKVIIGLALTLLAFLIRDGLGMALLIFLIANRLKFNQIYLIILSFISAIILDFFLVKIANITNLFVFERTLKFFNDNNTEMLPYLVRVFGNITNLTSRIIFLSETGKTSLTGISLFFCGIGIIYGTIVSFKNIILLLKEKKLEETTKIASYLHLFIICAFSFSPIIQPRYLITSAFFAIYFDIIRSRREKISFIIGIIAFSVALRIIYTYLNIDQAVVEDYDKSIKNYF